MAVPIANVLPTTMRARPSFAHVLDPLVADGRLVAVERRPATPGRTAMLRRPLADAIAGRLAIADLWAHQVEAVELLRSGHNVVVATGTGSGKSLCYQLPLAEALLDPIRPSTVLVIGPTKALAHDQIRALGAYDFPGVRAELQGVALTQLAAGGDELGKRLFTRRHHRGVIDDDDVLDRGQRNQHLA